MTGWVEPGDAEMRDILTRTRTIAVVGVSPNPGRDSNSVYRYLADTGQYQLFPVNPTISELDGEKVYPSLRELPVVPDLVDVFRRAEHLPAVADEAISVGAQTLWFQLGLWDDAVAATAHAAGLAVVMDRCLKVDHRRLLRRR